MEGPSPNTVLCYVGVVHRYIMICWNWGFLNFKVSQACKITAVTASKIIGNVSMSVYLLGPRLVTLKELQNLGMIW